MQASYKILVVEDEELMADRIEMLIEKTGHQLIQVVDNSEDALQVVSRITPDLILMDINIEGEYDGIELADLINEKQSIPIIFVTSLHDDRTFRRISRTNPIGYISKPFTDIQLQRSIELVFSHFNKKENQHFELDAGQLENQEYFFIKKGGSIDKILISDIHYLEADGRYCIIGLESKKYLIRQPLKEMLQRLARGQFLQVHRSYIVNMEKVSSINLEDQVIHLGKTNVPLSRREKDQVMKRLNLLK